MDQIRIAVSFLESRNGQGAACLTKGPEPVKPDQTYRYQHDRMDLIRALELLSERAERMLPPPQSSFAGIVGKEPYPVTKKAAEILKRLLIGGAARLRQLFAGSKSRSEVVATFLALWSSAIRNPYRWKKSRAERRLSHSLECPDEEENQ